MTHLTEEQVAAYQEDGYLALDTLVSHDEVEWLREIYDRLFAERAGRDAGDHLDLAGVDDGTEETRLPQIVEPVKYAPELATGHYRASCLAIAERLLGFAASYNGEHAIFKPPRVAPETPWHQDEAYWDPTKDYESLSFWIPLQPATVENGCMWFLPGSHHAGVRPHHTIGYDPRIHGLEVDRVDTEAAVSCPLAAGGCTIHGSRTLHYTGPNRSDEPRRAYILVYGTPPRPNRDGRRFPWNEKKRTARQARAAHSKPA
jgi:ectoine hydroxylase-related dioxygenase (phytanoyl-CoA dioxygenase family)